MSAKPAPAKPAPNPVARAAKITRLQLERFITLRDKRRALNREVDLLEREQKAIAADLHAATLAAGGQCKKFGFFLRLTERAGRPSWKDEYIASMGSDAAEKIQSACPPQLILDVTGPVS
jgi:hypothetical protein